MHGYGHAVNAVKIEPSAIASRRCGGVIAEQRLTIQGIVPNHRKEVIKRLDGASDITKELSLEMGFARSSGRTCLATWLPFLLGRASSSALFMVAAMVHHVDVRKRMIAWLDIALAPATVRRSLRVAMVVGSILVAINYGDRIVAGSLGSREFAKIALTYCVPYCVATYAAVSALLGAKRAS